jgi:hypothetical protein
MKQFDKDFSGRVKEAFGSYNADHLANAGWEAFVQKQNKSRGFLGLLPIWAKAASIAILLSLGSYMAFRAFQPNFQGEELVERKVREVLQAIPANKPEEQKSIPVPYVPKSTSQPSVALSKGDDKVLVENKHHNQLAVQDSLDEQEPDTLLLAEANNSIDEGVDLKAIQQKDHLDELDSKAVGDEYASTTYTMQQLVEPMAQAPRIQRTRIAAGLSGMVAAVENLISDAPGVSVGLYTEHKLSNKIYIRPGLALAKHSYGLQTLTSGNSDLMYDALPTASNNEYSSEAVLFENHLYLVAMEIPINFVFKIHERHNSNFFVSAGASSLVYLSQKFTGTSRHSEKLIDFSSGAYYLDSNTTSSVEVSNEYSAFSRLDFFGLLNLSAGYTFPFTDKSTMSVEPFVQLPLGPLTSNEMRMGFGGVSLKIQIK